MSALSESDPDNVLIATPSRTIRWEGDQFFGIGRFGFWRKVRRSYTVRAPALGRLIEIENALKVASPFGLEACVEVIAPEAVGTPFQVQQAIFDAHFAVSYPPKAKATETPTPPSATAPSSAVSSPSTDTPASTSSAS